MAKAVKRHPPLYGIEGDGWFLSYRCVAKYVKVTFFRGTSLRSNPPGASKHAEVCYLTLREDERLDGAQFPARVGEASRLPGEKL